MNDDMVKVSIYCGQYKGLMSLNDPYLEECEWETEMFVAKGDWDNEIVSVVCPECGATLEQNMDHFELIE